MHPMCLELAKEVEELCLVAELHSICIPETVINAGKVPLFAPSGGRGLSSWHVHANTGMVTENVVTGVDRGSMRPIATSAETIGSSSCHFTLGCKRYGRGSEPRLIAHKDRVSVLPRVHLEFPHASSREFLRSPQL